GLRPHGRGRRLRRGLPGLPFGGERPGPGGAAPRGDLRLRHGLLRGGAVRRGAPEGADAAGGGPKGGGVPGDDVLRARAGEGAGCLRRRGSATATRAWTWTPPSGPRGG